MSRLGQAVAFGLVIMVASVWLLRAPNQAPRMFRSFDGAQLAYGVEGVGSPVIFLHAFMIDSSTNWSATRVRETVVGAGFQTIWLDARGHGQSELLRDPGRYADQAMARDVAALISHLKLTDVTVVGYSMGSATAIQVAGMNASLKSLVLAGTSLDETQEWGRVDREREVQALRNGDDGYYSGLAKSLGGDRMAYAARLEGDHFPSFTHSQLQALALPVCIINGDQDADPKPMARVIPGARAFGVPGDHQTAVWSPEFREQLLACLRSVN